MDEKKENHLKYLYGKIIAIILVVVLCMIGIGYSVFAYMLGGLNRSTLDETKLFAEEIYGDSKIMNIALYGVDSRSNTFQGRSDAILIVSINARSGKVKLISVARDTYVSIPGYNQTKINHAYSYGGPELAIRTLNENFGMNITDYITVNFDSLAEVIDEMGGVMIDVTEAERKEINAYVLSGELLQESGYVRLNGPQAVSYARIRKIDSDQMRTARQRKVLLALFDTAKQINPMQYPAYIRKFLPMVETSLSNEEILKIASVITKDLVIEQAAFPNEYIKSEGKMLYGMWYYIYNLEQAAEMLRQYIYLDVPFHEFGISEENAA